MTSDLEYAARFARSEYDRRRRHDRALQARLDEAALIRAIAKAELEAKAERRRMETVRAQPWKQALDARISLCRRCGGWCWDGTCRGDCKTLNPTKEKNA